MKKKFLLLFLFCSTLVLALIGLSTEKTQASIGGDYPGMENGGGIGTERSETVKCTKNVTIVPSNPYWPVANFPTEEWYATAISCETRYVILSPCTPYNPCY